MKKVMIGILVLIPIIIVLIVGMVTSFVSTQTYIGVTSVSLGADTLDLNLSAIEPDEDRNRILNLSDRDVLGVTVLPERATNRTVTWQIDGEIIPLMEDELAGAADTFAYFVDDNGNKVTSNTTGRLFVNAYCQFTVTARAENHSAQCLVTITDDDVQAVEVVWDGGAPSVGTGDSIKLDARYTPLNSVVTAGKWTSDNPAVAKVDANGILTGISEGTANITMTAYKDNGDPVESAPFAVTVTAGLTKYGDTVVTHERTLSVADLGFSSQPAEGRGVNCTVSGGRITIDDDAVRAEVDTADGRVEFVVCAENEIVIENAEFFRYDGAESGDTFIVATDDMPLTLTAVWRSETRQGAPEVQWTSSAPETVEVTADGQAFAKKDGEVTVTARAADGAAAEIRLLAAKKLAMVNLQITDSSLKVGIARETVFASQKVGYDGSGAMKDGYVPNSIEFVTLFPTAPAADASDTEKADFYNAFVFSVDKPELASFGEAGTAESNVLTFNPAAITEKTVIRVTVEVKHKKYQNMPGMTSKTVDLTVVPGVEVNNHEELLVASEDSRYYEEYVVTENGEDVYKSRDKHQSVFNIVLGSDIRVDRDTHPSYPDPVDNKKGNPYEITICCNLYGNNHMIYSSEACCRYVSKTYRRDGQPELLVQRGDNTVISNVTLSSNRDVGDEITSGGESKGLKGYSLRFAQGRREVNADGTFNELSQGNHNSNMRLEYSIVENASSAIGISNSDTTIYGCIIRNTTGVGIYIPTNMDAEGNTNFSVVTTENVLMSNMIGTGMNFDFNGFDNGSNADLVNKALEEGRISTLVQKGFLDIYNWQHLDALSLLDTSTIDLSSIGIKEPKALIDAIMTSLSAALKDPKFDYLVQYYNGVPYVHFGFISTGLMSKSYFSPTLVGQSDRFELLSSNMLPETGDAISDILIGVIKGLSPLYIYCYGSDEGDIVPGAVYTVDSFIDRLYA